MHCSTVRDRQLQSPRILMLASADHEHQVEPTPYMQLTMAETMGRCWGWAISAMRMFDMPMNEPPKPRMKRPAMYTGAHTHTRLWSAFFAREVPRSLTTTGLDRHTSCAVGKGPNEGADELEHAADHDWDLSSVAVCEEWSARPTHVSSRLGICRYLSSWYSCSGISPYTIQKLLRDPISRMATMMPSRPPPGCSKDSCH